MPQTVQIPETCLTSRRKLPLGLIHQPRRHPQRSPFEIHNGKAVIPLADPAAKCGAGLQLKQRAGGGVGDAKADVPVMQVT